MSRSHRGVADAVGHDTASFDWWPVDRLSAIVSYRLHLETLAAVVYSGL